MGKTVLITGGTSGFGLETAKAFQSAGYTVIIASRNVMRIEEVVKKYNLAGGYSLDVTKHSQWIDIRNNILTDFGSIDILINNAGGGVKIARVTEQTEATINDSISLNLTSAIYGANVFAPDMIEKKDGFIVNVCSIAAYKNWENWSLYCCAKSGLRSFSETLNVELRPHGVRVICVMPGGATTNFQKNCDISEEEETLTASDVAREILHCVSQPKGVVIKEITVCGLTD